jgi:DNA replication licensing factor MCM4
MENLSSESEFNLLMSPSRNKKPQRQNTPLKNNSFLEASSSFFDKENQTPKQVPRKESFKSSPFVYPSSNTRLDTNKISERIQNTLTPSRSSRISMQKPQGNKSFVWGTTVDVGECINKFKDFFLNFSLSNRANYDGFSSNDKSPYYIRILEQRRLDGNRIVNLDCVNLLAYPSSVELYDQFLKYPQEIALDVMDFVITNCFRELYRDDPDITDDNSVFKVRPYNVNQVKNMRELDPRDIDKLISIRGFVIRVGNPIPELKVGFFKCNLCQYSLEVSVDDGKIKEPEKCANQNCNGGMGIIHERSKFYNKQVIRLQETPDSVPDGQTPHSVSLVVYDELLDAVKPGDRVEVTGIYRAMPLRLNERQHTLRMFFKTYLDVMHIQTLELLKMESRNSSAIEYHLY